MGRTEPEIYKHRINKFRTWFMSYLIEEHPNGCLKSKAMAAGAAKFEVSPATVKNWMMSVMAAEPNYIEYRSMRRIMVRYKVTADIEAIIIRQAKREAQE